jgi:ribosome-associated protein
LERLRKSATSLTIDELNDEIKAAITSTRKKAAPALAKAPAKKSAVKKAPAKKAVKKALPVKAVAKKAANAPAKKTPSKSVAKKR